MTAGMRPELVAEEELPGDNVTQRYATCSSSFAITPGAIMPPARARSDPRPAAACSPSDFKVHRTEGLRVVDASVFPRAPGLFIVSAIYMMAEKAADAIVADAKRNT